MRLIVRWLIITVSLFLAAWIVPGIEVVGGNAWLVYGIMAIILGLANVLIKPLLKFLSCGIILLTFGLFSLVINAAMLLLSSRIAESWFNISFHVNDFWSALLGGLIVSIVGTILNAILLDKKNSRHKS
jgi:putative membrane protein